MTRSAQILALCLLFACTPGRAVPAAGEATPVVEVQGLKNPEMRSYRSVVAGLDAFERYHGLAPAVPELRFRLRPKSGEPLNPAEGLALRIAGDEQSAPIEIARDGSFSIPRLEWAYDNDAILVLNRKSELFEGRAEIRSPGLPQNVRRLGDLRLECRVTLAIAKSEIPFLARAFITSMLLTSDWCGKDKVKLRFRAPDKLAGAALSFRGRTESIQFSGQGYNVPVGDTSWPDDTLIELQFAETQQDRQDAGVTP
jgi:hypothetical protein